MMQVLREHGIAADDTLISDPFTDTSHEDVIEAHALGS